MSVILEVQDIAKAFGGVKAVEGVSFSVAAGEVLALIGPNGAGKSTCFNMLNGQLKPDRGSVKLKGEAIHGLPPRVVARRGVGRTFQITATYGSMTVRENVQMAIIAASREEWRFAGRAGDLHTDKAMALLALVGMADQAARACGVLAYGDIKRVELAVALACNPALLLMDEPTAGMAPSERVSLMELAADIARERELAMLFTEHDMDVVFAHADRIIVLDRGKLIAEGSGPEVRANRAVQAVYLGSGHTYGEARA
ncbi:MAG: ABC transporter ATP-binding protein [Beijerinckiaceae bacterium]